MHSKIIYFFCVLLMLYASFFFYPRWQEKATNAAIAWDVSGYYWYLPSIFIYKDIKHIYFKDSILKKYQPSPDFQQGFLMPNGNYVMKYSSGCAVMYLPFFTAANLVARPLGYPQDGFSAPYQFAIQLGGFLVSLLGLWYFRKLLLLFYKDTVVAVVLLLLVVGTNYLNYAAIDTGMSHCWLFTIYVFILLNTYYFYNTRAYKYAIRLGLLIGLAILTRPTEIIAILIPLLWGMESISLKTIRDKFSFLYQQRKKIVVAIGCGIPIIFIQLAYWKYVSGHWYVYSYQGQGFSWLRPHIINYTLSYRCGWLTYCPMMFMAFAGIITYIKKGSNKLAIITFFLLNYYIVCSWDIWWYAGRAMVQSYPVLFFPIASLIDAMFRKKILLWILSPILLLFTYYNIWVTYHYHKSNIYDSDCMTNQYFWRVVGTWHDPAQEVIKLKDGKEIYDGIPQHTQLLYSNNFEGDTSIHDIAYAIEGTKSVHLNKDTQNSPLFSIPLSRGKVKWIRAQATLHCKDGEYNLWNMAQFIMHVTNKGKDVKSTMLRVYRFLGSGETKDIYIDLRLPNKNFDTITVSFWNAESDKDLWIDNVKVWGFND